MSVDAYTVIAGARRRGWSEGMIARKLGLKDGHTGYGITRQDGQRQPVVVVPGPPVAPPAPPTRELEPAPIVPVSLFNPILRAVGAAWDTTPEKLLSKRRAQRLARPRQAMYLLMRRHTKLSLTGIARAMGFDDHSTLVRGLRRAAVLHEGDADWRRRFDIAEARLQSPAAVP